MWAMHMDVDDPALASVRIFVNGTTSREAVLAEINKAQTSFRQQIEPFFSEAD